MKKEDIIKFAAIGQLPAEAMTCPERALYYTLKDVYSRLRQGSLDKSQGENLKNHALKQYELDLSALESSLKILRQNAELWKAIETAGNAYRLNRTLDLADIFIETVYGVRIKQKEENAEGSDA